jgi:hypothetical protein
MVAMVIPRIHVDQVLELNSAKLLEKLVFSNRFLSAWGALQVT